ncbi:MAG: UrcA family protein [Gammaproteobacteria bacterium]|nr:UrcA family protein [Gammaproteobacteria bacterium]
MKKSIVIKGLITAAAIVAISAPAAASLGTDKALESNSVRVSYADLNLEKEAGAQTLYNRLQRASKQACGVKSYRNAGSIGAKTAMHRCYREALSASIKKIDNDELTKIHEG